jgi:tetratricopeptide (TPR) repeat protein
MLVALSTDAWRVQNPADWKSAQQFAELAVEMADKLKNPQLLSSALGALATSLDGQSLLSDHLSVAKRRVEISKQDQEFKSRERIDALRGMGAAHMYVGEYAEALPYLEEAESLATNIRAVDQIANATGIMAQCYFRMDRWDDVLKVEEQWRDLDLRYTRERVGET